MMQKLPKKTPPANKRHTKPCKYFQRGNCTLPPSVCNFAHTMITPPAPPSRGVAVCRYYTTGSCHSGAYCPYKHLDDVSSPHHPSVQIANQDHHGDWQPFSSPTDSKLYDFANPYPPHTHRPEWAYDTRGKDTPTLPPPGYQPNQMLPPYYGHPSKHGVHSNYTSSDSSGSPIVPFSPQGSCGPRWPLYLSQPRVVSRSHSDDTTISSSYSNSSADLNVEAIVAVTEGLKIDGHPHDHRMQTVMVEPPNQQYTSLFPAPPYGTPISLHEGRFQPSARHGPNGYKSHRSVSGSTPGGSRATSRNSTRAHIKYKTKPCKFWMADGTCTAGATCTFRHDEPMPMSITPFEVSTTAEMRAPQPQQPSSNENYFPISWRVIGGGVIIGSNKAPSATSESSILDAQGESLDVSDPPPEKATRPPPPLKGPVKRRRSNSIPLTPSTPQIVVGSLFSAESPGVL